MELLQQPLFVLSLLLIAGTILYHAMLRRRQGMEQERIQHLCNRVARALADTDQNLEQKPSAFPHLLREAAGHTSFQRPRLRLQSGIKGEAPEKYRYFKVLRQKGMAIEEIADILDISLAEASQLAALSMAVSGARG